MRKIYFKYSTGYCGSDGAEVLEFHDDVTDEELDDAAWHGALSNAEMYGIYPESDLEDISDEEYERMEEEGELDNYSHNIEGSWEDYNPEKHDGTY